MTLVPASASVVLLSGWVLGCNVEPVASDHCGADLESVGTCPAGAVVVMSDYVSTQVALARLDGRTVCGSFASTARAEASGVAFALSGDVTVPSSRAPSGRVVLVDRYGTNVVSWLDPRTGTLLGQLAVGTGFESNPQDYVELSDGRAFVSRWGENPFPGSAELDGGGDVLVLDSIAPALLRRIPMPRHDDVPPRPAGLTLVGERIVVTLQRASLDVRSMADAELVGIDTSNEEIAFTLRFDGLKNCGALAPSPDGSRAALACTGYIDPTGAGQNLDESALVLLDFSTSPPTELRRLRARDLVGEPLQGELDFFGDGRLLVKTQTAVGAGSHNRLLALDLETDLSTELAVADSSGDGRGQGVVFGSVLCTPGCGDVCLLADGGGRIRRWSIEAEELVPLGALTVADSVGLPPRDLGVF